MSGKHRLPAPKRDRTLAAAVDLARQGATEVAVSERVGQPLDFVMDGELVGTHFFACDTPAYQGWRWAVTLSRAPRSKAVTISEVHLLPGPDALQAPEWVPWSERLRPGDVGPGDITPLVADDPFLEAGFEATGQEEVDALAFFELGLGRPRVLSGEGREAAAQRWYDGANGPRADTALRAPANCSSCGYFVPLAGLLQQAFGVCASQWSPADGRVVSLDHGCGAHSEVDMPQPAAEHVIPPIVDEFAVDPL